MTGDLPAKFCLADINVAVPGSREFMILEAGVWSLRSWNMSLELQLRKHEASQLRVGAFTRCNCKLLRFPGSRFIHSILHISRAHSNTFVEPMF